MLLGCGASLEDALPGKYRAEADISGVAPEFQDQARAASAMISGVKIEIRKDKSLSFNAPMGQSEGTWAIENGEVTISLSNGGRFPKLRPEEGGHRLVPVFSESEQKALQGARIWLKKE